MAKEMTVTKAIKRSPAIALLALMLAACNQADTRPPENSGGDEAEAPPPQSIIRPDVEQAPPAAALTPLNTSISFADGGAQLSEGALAELATVRSSPQMAEGGPIILRGHSDAGGSDAVNMRASEARAQAVADWLIEMGIAEERIAIIAFGEQNPVEPNAKPDGTPNEAGREANRRVDVTIALPRSADVAEAPEANQPTD